MGRVLKPDLVVPWPTHCDYPLWRAALRRERDRYGDVVVVLTPPSAEADLSAFVTERLQSLGATVARGPGPQQGVDWRDAATREGLRHAWGEWVWFTEQDFEVLRPEAYWGAVDERAAEAVGHREGDGRWHPSSLLVRRELVDALLQAGAHFGADPVDHFFEFGRRLEAAAPVADLERDLGLARERDFRHMAGLSYNHQLVEQGDPVGYKPAEFRAYLLACLDSGEALHPAWEKSARRHLQTATDGA